MREVVLFTVKESVNTEPEVFADAIFPVIFPAIKRAISAFFEAAVQSFNRLLDRSLSLHAIRWRFEAWRTGKTFAEVVLLHSLVYRVEMVLLIQHQTGFMLDHVIRQDARLADPELISGMVTAVQDFIQDTVRQKEHLGTSGTLQFGDYTVWTERGSKATIAAFFHGHPPEEFRETLRVTLYQIQRRFWRELESPSRSQEFAGRAVDFLRQCLDADVSPVLSQSKLSRYLPITALLIAVFLIWGLLHSMTSPYDVYLDLLANTPGIVVTRHETIPGGKVRISGLRDRFAPDLGALEAKAGVDSASIVHDFKPYISEDPPVLSERIAFLLQAPPEVQVNITDQGGVELSGSAPFSWIQKTREQVEGQGGLVRYDLSRVVDQELLRARELEKNVEEQTFAFAPGSAKLSPLDDSRIRDLGQNLLELDRLLKSTGRGWTLQVQGHADEAGGEAFNLDLSQRRAAVVVKRMREAGVRAGRIEGKGFGFAPVANQKSGDLRPVRWVTFQLKIRELKEGNLPHA